MRVKTMVCACLIAAAAQQPLAAQESAGWEFTLVPYGWILGLDGKVGIGDREVDVDASFGDIWDNLEMGALLHFEAERGKLTLMTDLIFLGVGQPVTTRLLEGDVDVDVLAIEGAAAYAVAPVFEVLAGVRFVRFDSRFELESPVPVSRGTEEQWVDPIVGGRLRVPLGNSPLEFIGRGDIGGFGIGSDFAWQLATHLGVQVTDWLSILAGYRWLDIDYEDTEGTPFLYDIQTSGPQVGAAFHF